MVERHDWDGLLARRGRQDPSIRLVMLLPAVQRSTVGATAAFLGVASDGRRYWVKVFSSRIRGHMLAADQIVGRLGTLIGAATCSVATIAIAKGLAWHDPSGAQLSEGVGHASEHIEGALETRDLDRPRDDDNARRYTSFAALYDWAWGDDVQGLHALGNDARFYSHDHGQYLPPGRGDWHAKVVEDFVDTPHEFPGLTLDVAEAIRLAVNLDSVTRDAIASTLSHTPLEWGVPDRDLESLGYYLERRAPQTAARLRKRVGGTL